MCLCSMSDSVRVQVNMDKSKAKLEEIDGRLQEERAKLGTVTADLQTYEQRCVTLPSGLCLLCCLLAALISVCWRRHAREKQDHDSVAAETEKAQAQFKEFERKDVKVRNIVA